MLLLLLITVASANQWAFYDMQQEAYITRNKTKNVWGEEIDVWLFKYNKTIYDEYLNKTDVAICVMNVTEDLKNKTDTDRVMWICTDNRVCGDFCDLTLWQKILTGFKISVLSIMFIVAMGYLILLCGVCCQKGWKDICTPQEWETSSGRQRIRDRELMERARWRKDHPFNGDGTMYRI